MKNFLEKQKLLFSVLVLSSALLTSAAGYVGELPEIDETKIDPPPPFVDMAPAAIPDFRPEIKLKKGKYYEYLRDTGEIIPILEDMKALLLNKDKDLQLFCAKANMLNLYMDSLRTKYNSKTERYYESFKQLNSAVKTLNDASDYWRYTYRYNSLLRSSVKDRQTDEKIMKGKFSTAIKSINTALSILKENNQPATSQVTSP